MKRLTIVLALLLPVIGEDVFVGCFPADKPKYAVCMVILRKHQLPASPAMVSDKVNELIDWLKKK